MSNASPAIDRGKIEAKLREAYEKVKAALSEEQNSTWKHEKTDKKAGVEILSRKNTDQSLKTDILQFKSVGTVHGLTAEEATKRVLQDGERRTFWNPIHDSTSLLDSWTTSADHWQIQVIHERHHNAVGGLVSPRDFVKATARFNGVNQGEFWFVYVSVDAEAAGIVAPNPNFTRAIAFPCGTKAVSIPGSPENPSCVLQTLVHADPAGKIPSWIIEKGVAGELIDFFIGVNKAFATPQPPPQK